MAATTEEVPVGRTGGSPGPGVPWRVKLRNDSRLAAILFLLPAVLILVGLLGYPLVLGVWLSLTDETLAESGHFVGLSNFIYLVQDPVFRTAVFNTVLYTVVSIFFKYILGMALALLLTRVLTPFLFGVSATDGLTFVATAMLLGLAALLASWLPARRASSVDPVVALRQE